MPDHARDFELRELSELRFVTQDRERSTRVRARCHATLARRERHQAQEGTTDGFGRRVLVPAAVLGFCALYVASLFTTALLRSGF